MNISTVNELIQSLESAGELSIKEQKYLELAKAYQQLAAENARYSMSAGHADQRMAESRAVRSALGFKPDADDVSPSDLVEAINQIMAELCVIRTAHPQPLGPAMDAAIDAFNAEEMPETGMLNSYFILRESIRIKTPATDRIVAGIKASAIPEGFKLVPEQMYLSDEDIQAICMQCGNGDKKGYGDYEDGILWVGELSNDGEMKYGLNIANANYPEEGSITVFEFDEPLREGAK
ncbi:hypothetical protein ABEG14_15125 [Klebsiella michiganensis]